MTAIHTNSNSFHTFTKSFVRKQHTKFADCYPGCLRILSIIIAANLASSLLPKTSITSYGELISVVHLHIFGQTFQQMQGCTTIADQFQDFAPTLY